MPPTMTGGASSTQIYRWVAAIARVQPAHSGEWTLTRQRACIMQKTEKMKASKRPGMMPHLQQCPAR